MPGLPFTRPLALIACGITLATTAAVWKLSDGHIASPGALRAANEQAHMRGGVTSHAQLDCAGCHTGFSGGTTSQRCVACHDDVQAELAQSGLHAHFSNHNECLACHTEHRGSTASLTRLAPDDFPHDATGFSLAAHQKTHAGQAFGCSDCHAQDIGRFEVQRCQTCHAEYQARFVDEHALRFGKQCLACHDGVDRFAGFDHAATSFPLVGAHRDSGCEACHANARTSGDFARAPTACTACHAKDDAHQGAYGTSCESCHDATAWKPARFDHSTSRFPLTGAHRNVTCENCHRGGQYRGTPTACESCHPEPASHRGTFGNDCKACHTTDSFSGATFTHRFPIRHGNKRGSPCQTCHPDNYKTYTCYGCHKHTPAKIERKHRKEGIADFSDCMKCHPDGREHD